MCIVAHIAAPAPPPIVPWNEAEPGFYTEPVGDPYTPILPNFSHPHVVYAGSHEGCGCGFRNVWGGPEQSQRDLTPAQFRGGQPEDDAVASSTSALVRYVRDLVARHGAAEIYTVWDGDQSLPPIDEATLTLEQLDLNSFYLLDRRLLRIRA